MYKVVFNPKTGEFIEGLEIKAGYSISLRQQYRVEIYKIKMEETLKTEIIYAEVYDNEPTEKEILGCIVVATQGDLWDAKKLFVRVVKEFKVI